MPSRPVPFINGQIYHIYNRGSEKRWIFEDLRCYNRFLKTAKYYQYSGPKPRFSTYIKNSRIINSSKNVEILAYCLMPNHYHLLIRQLKDNGISDMVSRLANSYTKYFNSRFKRVGALFQGEFKAVLIEDDEQLIHVSRYIHLNPVVGYLAKKPYDYTWSSFNEYTKKTTGICSTELILDLTGSPEKYEQFVLDQIDYATTLEKLKHQLFDEV